MPPEGPGDALATMEHRARANLGPVVYGQAISLFGDYLAFFTLPLFVVALTGRERDLGLTSAAETLPMLLFGLAAGVLLDRLFLRRSLIFSDLVRAAAFVLLAAASLAEVATMWMVLAVAFLVGSMAVFFDSGLQAMLPAVLTDDLLVTANTRLQLAVTAATVAGPAAGGLIVAGLGGFAAAFFINAATFVVSAALLLFVRELRKPPARTRGAFGAELLEGLRFLWAERRLRWATIGAAGANLAFAPVAATLVLYADEELGLGTRGIGAYFALYALIGAFGVVAAPRITRRLGLGRTFVVGMAMLGGGFVVVSFAAGFTIAVLATGVAFAGVSWLNIALATLRQRLAPPDLAGRVIAASRSIGWIGLPVGAAAGGFIADATGIIPLYRIGSLALLVVTAILVLTPLWTERAVTA